MSASTVAYFCMEYGLESGFTIYAGGLGVLAGDHVKSAGDLRVPLIAIGLLWDEGYTRQAVNQAGGVDDFHPKTPRDLLRRLDARFEVTVQGKSVPCTAWRVEHIVSVPLYLIEPIHEEDRWITQRLYGGGEEDRVAQEVLLGVGGVRLLSALGIRPEIFHFNEGHAVFAGLELLRENRFGGDNLAERVNNLRTHVVFTTHTPVAAGNEVHSLELLRKVGADLGFSDEDLGYVGGNPFSMTVAGLRMARIANAVAELHGDTARKMWKDVERAAPIVHVTNGVHPGTWQDARIRAALAPDKDRGTQDAQLAEARAAMKDELITAVGKRAGVHFRRDQILIGFARRAASYKRADLILGDHHQLSELFGRGVQLVFSGKAHPKDIAGKSVVSRLAAAAREFPGHVAFVNAYDMELGALLTRGVDVWLNNPRRPLEASGTSGMKAAMNGVPNLSILDGWWPEGCRHGETGWKIGDPDPSDDAFSEVDAPRIDSRDRASLYRVLFDEVLPAYADRGHWTSIMRASVAMSSWRFSSDRMVEEYVRNLYWP
ncbi:MAG: alpha-glucan family phosphorylase [Myxococcales bacterium]|nr:alpha-glucan family phosphorylase [Myxococcales bacterium]HRC55795.1 alpha-glucan family phosphorylase [Kofleriaceae bacterium]